MPETASEKLRCERRRSGHQHKAQQQSDKTAEQLEWSCPPSQARQSQVSPPPSRSKGWNNVEGRRQAPLDPSPSLQYQHRPSVLRQGTPAIHRLQLENSSSQPVSPCKVERSSGQHSQSSPPHPGPAPRHTLYSSPPRTGSPKQSPGKTRPQDCNPRGGSALFVSGLCRWPGCDAALDDFPSFLKHLYSDHGHSDKSIAQWKVQQDMVQYMESQLTLEKQKLFAMQLHLQLSEHKFTEVNLASDWPYSMALFLPQPQAADGGRVPRCATKDADELAQRAYYWHAGTAHLLPDLVPSIECYKYNNIRPPYTYACLIRWSILESPDKQRTLNEIYTWFTTMFFYFRHNTATWKNAVRHNLSLHKCFVRVEGGKGAVWTVDETEYQRRKGQKYYRDHPAKWLAPYPNFNPEEP